MNEKYKDINSNYSSFMHLSRGFDTIELNFVYWNWNGNDLNKCDFTKIAKCIKE